MNDDTNGGRGSLRGIRRCLSAVIGPRVAETFVRQSARGRCVKPHMGHAAMRLIAANGSRLMIAH